MDNKNRTYKLLTLVTIISLFLGFLYPTITHSTSNPRENIVQPARAASSDGYTVYLPITVAHFTLNTIFGVQPLLDDPVEVLDTLTEQNTSWLRINGVLWSKAEPNQGDRLWENLADLDQILLEASQDYQNVILSIRSTPSWAQTIDGADCSPIKTDKLTAFGKFVYDTVLRYSKPPYNVKYWEIWNEPDVPYSPSIINGGFGCWGDTSDDYYGGGYYADVLKVVYPKIKAADPKAKVIVGGLLLDCDPRPDSNYCAANGKDTRPPKYLEGILLNGGADYFDGVSYHGYDYFPYWEPELGHYYNGNWNAYWNTTGPVSSVKAGYVREILDKYDVTGKFIMNTEAALICGPTGATPGQTAGCESDDTSDFEQTKARYLVQEYAQAIKDNLVVNTWYSILGWRNSGLLNSDFSSRPAFESYEYAKKELMNANFSRDVTDYSDLFVYEFKIDGRTIWLMWSQDGESHTITLPSTPKAIHDMYGMDLTALKNITVTLDPIYVDW